MHQFNSSAGRLKQMTIDIWAQEEKERAVECGWSLARMLLTRLERSYLLFIWISNIPDTDLVGRRHAKPWSAESTSVRKYLTLEYTEYLSEDIPACFTERIVLQSSLGQDQSLDV